MAALLVSQLPTGSFLPRALPSTKIRFAIFLLIQVGPAITPVQGERISSPRISIAFLTGIDRGALS